MHQATTAGEQPQLVLFTDLDGTLLDHDTYAVEPALPALEIISRQHIPLVVCTSKTAAEIQALRDSIGNTDPFISENGGGIFVPEKYFPFSFLCSRTAAGYQVIALGVPYGRLTTALKEIITTTGLSLRGFSMMGDDEVAQLCNFSRAEAALARRRDYDEPFIIADAAGAAAGRAEELLRDAAARLGLMITRGGRFFHLTGAHDKGKAVRILLDLFERRYGTVYSIGFGDSSNDLPMLRETDAAVVIPRKDGTFAMGEVLKNCMPAAAPGPAGWAASFITLYRRFSQGR